MLPQNGADTPQQLQLANSYDTGMLGEEQVADYLCAHGWRILGRRVRTKWGEIDIVARRRDLVAFVEVKSAGPGRIRTEHAVSPGAQHRIRRAAVAWIATQSRQYRGIGRYRFDVALVQLATSERPSDVRWVRNAF